MSCYRRVNIESISQIIDHGLLFGPTIRARPTWSARSSPSFEVLGGISHQQWSRPSDCYGVRQARGGHRRGPEGRAAESAYNRSGIVTFDTPSNLASPSRDCGFHSVAGLAPFSSITQVTQFGRIEAGLRQLSANGPYCLLTQGMGQWKPAY
jgi:hypothetical protein